MTNPNDAVGTNAAYGTRTSVNAFNDFCQLVNGRGVLSGWEVVPKSGMTVSVGGQAGIRDVAVAEDNLGNKTTINNRLSTSVDIEVPAASLSSNRYDAIVVYANNPAQAADETPDAPSVCGIIEVQGDQSGVSEAQIRSAISADGGTGSVAYYAVLATIFVGAGTSVITSANISQKHIAISASDIADGEIVSSMIDWTTLGDQASYLKLGNILIQWGQKDGGDYSTTDGTVTLPTPFANANYIVTVSGLRLEQGSSFWWAFVKSKTTTSFTFRNGFKSITTTQGGGSSNNSLCWIAIGLAPQ